MIMDTLSIARRPVQLRPRPCQVVKAFAPLMSQFMYDYRWSALKSRHAGKVEELRLPCAVGIVLCGDKDAVPGSHSRIQGGSRSGLALACGWYYREDYMALATAIKLAEKNSLPTAQ